MIRVGVVGVAPGHGRAWSEQLSGLDGEKIGMRVVNVWDEDTASAAKVAQRISAKAVSRLEEVAEGVDGVLLTEELKGLMPERYLQLGKLFLERGIPVFFDRPYAASVGDLEEIIRLSKKYDTPIMAASALDFSPTIEQARTKITEITPVLLFQGIGPGLWIPFYLPHIIACIIGALGTGVESVLTLSFERNEEKPELAKSAILAYLTYRKDANCGPASGVLGMVTPDCEYYKFLLKIFGKKGELPEIDCFPAGLPAGYFPLLKKMADFFRTRQEPIPHNVTIEKTKIFYAVQQSASEKRKVYL